MNTVKKTSRQISPGDVVVSPLDGHGFFLVLSIVEDYEFKNLLSTVTSYRACLVLHNFKVFKTTFASKREYDVISY